MEGKVDDSQWYGQSSETEQTRLEDPGVGRPIILRKFDFAYKPGRQKPKKSEILTPGYITFLENILWVDNLELIQDPKVAYNKTGFSVLATCQAKKGHIIPYDKIEQLKPIHTKLQEEHGRKNKG